MLIDATAVALGLEVPRVPLVAKTAFHESHSLSGKVMGLMTALKQMLSASETVSLPGSLCRPRNRERSHVFQTHENSDHFPSPLKIS